MKYNNIVSENKLTFEGFSKTIIGKTSNSIIEELYIKYLNSLVDSGLAHNTSIHTSVDWDDTQDYFGITEVKVKYINHEVYKPIEYVNMIIQFKTVAEVLGSLTYNKLLDTLENTLDENYTVSEINSNMC